MLLMQPWRIFLAIWLIVSGIVWIVRPTFPYAFQIMGILAILAAVFLLLSVREKNA